MATKGLWSYKENYGIDGPKLGQKLALVSPKMDVDVTTGVPTKNRTHLIDHPRDDGQKHREQLWSFQQKYRGAIGKLRNLPELKSDGNGNEESLEDLKRSRTATSTLSNTSLPSRFRQRYAQRIRANSKTQDRQPTTVLKGKGYRELSESETIRPTIERLYSSGLIVKNTLYQQLRGEDTSYGRRTNYIDEATNLETLDRFGGSLERLPEITGYQQSRFKKTGINHYSRKYGEHDRRMLSLRRSFTNISELDSTRRKLLMVSKREKSDSLSGVGCIDSGEDSDDEDEDDEDEEDDEDDGDGDDEELRNERREIRRKKIERFLSIASDNLERDASLKLPLESVRRHKSSLVPGEDGCDVSGDVVNSGMGNRGSGVNGAVCTNDTLAADSKHKGRDGGSGNTCSDDRDAKMDNLAVPKPLECRSGSNESLDIPKERCGPTTHSVDKKLSIRKPWEWRPSPYRWTEKTVRESDKPYIEKILNRGEIIDEYNYDSFARTKPLKVANVSETYSKGIQR